MTTLEALNQILPGWTESRTGGLLCNHAKNGAIIDQAVKSGEWFAVTDAGTLEGYATREDAVEAYIAANFKAS